MGSHGDSWVQCVWCSIWGQCKYDVPAPYASMIDIDGTGVLCDPCQYRFGPPHYEYLSKVLGVKWSVAVSIANFAYPVCAKTDNDWKEAAARHETSSGSGGSLTL